MLVELHHKSGNLCPQAKAGQIQCPLIVRNTSEDVITSHLVQAFRILNPRWFLPDLLNRALGTKRFSRQIYRQLQIKPWVNKPPYPRELTHWPEGSSQIDIEISWENPPTVIYIEAKYRSSVSATTSGNDGSHGYPSDQITRNVRVGLWECGWHWRNRLFEVKPRDFIFILLTPNKGHQLIQTYQDPRQVRTAIPHGGRLIGLPQRPFIGELSYGDITTVLRQQARWFTRAERQVISELTAYLDFKRSAVLPRREIQGVGQTKESPKTSARERKFPPHSNQL